MDTTSEIDDDDSPIQQVLSDVVLEPGVQGEISPYVIVRVSQPEDKTLSFQIWEGKIIIKY